MQPFWQRFEQLSHKLTPALLMAFMVLIAAIPFRFPGINAVMPAFALIAIYYWNIFCPGILPYSFLFALGLLQDTLIGTPLGVSSLVNLSMAFLIMRERRTLGKMLFGSIWFGFILFAGLAFALQWVIVSFYYGAMLHPVSSLLLQWCTTVLVYPLCHLVFARIYRAMLRA